MNGTSRIYQLWFKTMRVILFTLLCLFPIRMTHIFLELSLTLLFFKGNNDPEKELDIDKFMHFMGSKYTKVMVDLPNYTLAVMWTEETLNKQRKFGGRLLRIKEAIKDEKALYYHLNEVVGEFLNDLPSIVKFKIGHDLVNKEYCVQSKIVALITKRIRYTKSV